MQKKLMVALATGLFLTGMTGIANAAYVEPIDVIDVLGDNSYSVSGQIAWIHSYDFSEPNPIIKATLTIVADDVDVDEDNKVTLWTSDGSNSFDLGFLKQGTSYSDWEYKPGHGAYGGEEIFVNGVRTPVNNMANYTTTEFDLLALITDHPDLLSDEMPLVISVENSYGVEIETSTLRIEGSPVPVPATALLFGTGLLGLVGISRRKKSPQA